MKVAIVEYLDEAKQLSSSHELVLVLKESFESTAHMISIPGDLDGSSADHRNSYLELLSKILRPEQFDAFFPFARRILGTAFSSFLTVFELNMYSRHREFAGLLAVSQAIKEIQKLTQVETIAYKLRDSSQARLLVQSLRAGGVYFQNLSRRPRISTPTTGLVILETAKSALVSFSLLLKTLFASRLRVSQSSNVVIDPVTGHEKDLHSKACSSYWGQGNPLGKLLGGQLEYARFSSGLFFDSSGRLGRVGHWGTPFFDFLLVLLVSASVFLKLLVGWKKLSTFSTSEGRVLSHAIIRSLSGPNVVETVWAYLQFQRFFKSARPGRVFYLFEQQPWERAMILAARHACPTSRFFGVAHVAVRPWDIRYFPPIEWFNPKSTLPLPDLVLATSKTCQSRLHGHWGENLTIELVESLRFLTRRRLAPREQVILTPLTYSREEVNCQLEFIESLRLTTALTNQIKIQPHPLIRDESHFPRSNLNLITPALVLTDSSSNSVLDATENGIPSLSLRCGPLPNLSPLSDVPWYQGNFVFPDNSSHPRIRSALERESQTKAMEYFERSPDLRAWRRLLTEGNFG